MKPYFNTKQRQDALVFEALEWIGTEFMLNARAKGRYVSCHNLIIGIYEEFGIELDFDSPRGTGKAHDQAQLQEVAQWVSQNSKQLVPISTSYSALRPGDVVTFISESRQHHIALYLGTVDRQEHTVINSLPPFGVTLSNLLDDSFSRGLAAAFRLMQ